MFIRNYEGSEILPSLQVSHRFTDAGRNTKLMGSLCSPVRRLGHKEPYTYKQPAACFYLRPLPLKIHKDSMEGLGWTLCTQRLCITAEEPQAWKTPIFQNGQ